MKPQGVSWPTIDGAPPRQYLLLAATAFVRTVCSLPGITRIALIGSLTTDKPDPKDIDLLLTVAPNADIAELDRLARKLQGQISATARGLYGADVFLADPASVYLGRLCKHRECPSLRQCLARHCGARPHLKDDLAVITLDAALIAAPPIVLWPVVAASVPVPVDVQEILLAVAVGNGVVP